MITRCETIGEVPTTSDGRPDYRDLSIKDAQLTMNGVFVPDVPNTDQSLVIGDLAKMVVRGVNIVGAQAYVVGEEIRGLLLFVKEPEQQPTLSN